MNEQLMLHRHKHILDEAVNAHHAGHIEDALAAYEKYIIYDSEEPLALYGVAIIKISRGDIGGYSYAIRALTSPRHSTLDKSSASESLLSFLLSHQYQDHARELLHTCELEKISLSRAQEFYNAVQIPHYLQPARYDPLLQRELERYRPIESGHYVYAIDIVGGCNLRCPTCPVGNQELPKGMMSLAMYQQILSKIRRESPDRQADIWLFNWTEPLLHPHIEDFIKATHSQGMTSFISSNLNIGHRLKNVIRAAPTRLKISLSSLKQSTYGHTHARGDIDKVIENMRALARWRDQYQSPTQIWIGHHLYRNTLHEQADVKALADELGFEYAASPAIVAPLERVMAMMDNPQADDVTGLRKELLYDPLQIRAVMAQKRSGRKDCELRFNMTAIQHDGMVNLCCATTQTLGKKPVHFLEHSHEVLEDMKYTHSFCKQCMDANLHLTIADC